MRDLAYAAVRAACFVALTMALLSGAGRASAEPTEAQVAAIKANCRSDYMSYCWSVPRGGPEAAQCLKNNLAKLSPACQQAVKAATAAAAPPAAPVPQAQPSPAAASPAAPPTPEASPATEAAKPAAETPAVPPSPSQAKPAAPAPAAATPAASSPPTEAKAEDKSAAAPSAAQPAAEAPASDTAPLIIGTIPPRKKLMVFRNCRKDLEAYCGDVSYGEGRQLHCLFNNKAALSPDCRDTLAKLTN